MRPRSFLDRLPQRTLATLFVVALALSACRQDACQSPEERTRGREALRMGDTERAQRAWNLVLDACPADPEARAGLAMSLYAAAEEREDEGLQADSAWWEAARALRLLLRVDSTSAHRSLAATSLFQVARRRLAADQPQNAVRLLQEALRLDSLDWYSWNLLALAQENLGQEETAIRIYERIIVENPPFVDAYVNLGNLFWRRGAAQDAWEYWSLGLEQDSANAYLQYWTGLAETKLQGEEAAR